MIKVLINHASNGQVNFLEIKGHANSAPHGEDLVCAEVSAVVTGGFNNLKNYKSDSVIQETALAYLVHNFSQRDDILNACRLFNQIDVSGDGKINKTESYKGLSKKYPLAME